LFHGSAYSPQKFITLVRSKISKTRPQKRDEERIETYLRSLEKQLVNIGGINLNLAFEADELIHTEFSYKYSIYKIEELAKYAGLSIKKIWHDQNNYFAVVLFGKY